MAEPSEDEDADDVSTDAGHEEQDWGEDEPIADLGGDILQFIGAFLIFLSLASLVFMGLCFKPKAGFAENIGSGIWLFGTMGVGLALSWAGKNDAVKRDPLVLYFMPAIMIVAVYAFWVFAVGRK